MIYFKRAGTDYKLNKALVITATMAVLELEEFWDGDGSFNDKKIVKNR